MANKRELLKVQLRLALASLNTLFEGVPPGRIQFTPATTETAAFVLELATLEGWRGNLVDLSFPVGLGGGTKSLCDLYRVLAEIRGKFPEDEPHASWDGTREHYELVQGASQFLERLYDAEFRPA
ncbi:MAG: hypothetical protein A2542_01600 [Parcubacteria group bacterium RIFOXYD2_FULL_52_8]|nr:MAG: hypothetical protein A2542_01600 [Parcubacteria group bacterium RIFOXYD2_FULL_52_8]